MAELGITTAQTKAIRKIRFDQRGFPPHPDNDNGGPGPHDMDDDGFGRGPRGSRFDHGGPPRFDVMNARSTTAALALLTAEQVQAWKTMTGTPFTGSIQPDFPIAAAGRLFW